MKIKISPMTIIILLILILILGYEFLHQVDELIASIYEPVPVYGGPNEKYGIIGEVQAGKKIVLLYRFDDQWVAFDYFDIGGWIKVPSENIVISGNYKRLKKIPFPYYVPRGTDIEPCIPWTRANDFPGEWICILGRVKFTSMYSNMTDEGKLYEDAYTQVSYFGSPLSPEDFHFYGRVVEGDLQGKCVWVKGELPELSPAETEYDASFKESYPVIVNEEICNAIEYYELERNNLLQNRLIQSVIQNCVPFTMAYLHVGKNICVYGNVEDVTSIREEYSLGISSDTWFAWFGYSTPHPFYLISHPDVLSLWKGKCVFVVGDNVAGLFKSNTSFMHNDADNHWSGFSIYELDNKVCWDIENYSN